MKYIKELNIEVDDLIITKIKDLKIPKGKRLLTFAEAVYIYDNDLLEDFPCKDWDLIQQFSKKNKKKGFKYTGLFAYGFGCGLGVGGGYVGSSDSGCLFGVRFVKDVKI